MTAADRIVRQVKPELEAAIAADDRETSIAHLGKAIELLQKATRKLPRKSLAPGRTKAQRAAEHRASTGDLRAAVLTRSDGHCEACRADLGTAWDLHHVLQGGLRRSGQAMGNVLALCLDCHRRWHRNDRGTMAQIARAVVLDAEARRAVEHRIDKIEAARRTA